MLRSVLYFTCLFFLFYGCATVDHTARINSLQESAAQGDPESQFQLAVAYDQGIGVTQNLDEAVKWYRTAAVQNHAEAQNSMGSLYQAGEGVPKDYQQAVSWYRKATEQGHPSALNNLGYMFDIGLGVSEDNKKAAELYKKAAELCNIKAMLNLGVLLMQGQKGVNKDYVEAYKWLDLARFYTQRSNDMQLKWNTRGALDELTKMMTAEEIKMGEDLTREWDKANRSRCQS